MYNKPALMDLVRSLALQIGQFKLASGKMSSYYLDCRKVTLDSAGANLIAEGMLEHLGNNLPDAVGGMAIGADPITAAIITVAGREGKKNSAASSSAKKPSNTAPAATSRDR